MAAAVLALLDARTRYAAPVEAVCALLPGASPADIAGAKALARSGRPPNRSASNWPPSVRSPPERHDEPSAVGDRPVRDHRRAGRRHDLALPLRQVRLDHPVLGTPRIAPAAHRQPAVPLR